MTAVCAWAPELHVPALHRVPVVARVLTGVIARRAGTPSFQVSVSALTPTSERHQASPRQLNQSPALDSTVSRQVGQSPLTRPFRG